MKLSLTISLVAATAAPLVNAHGYMSQPAAVFKPGVMNTNYIGILTESVDAAFAGKKWNDSPENNVAMFTSTFPSSSFKTLKAMFDTKVTDCGNTVTTGSAIDVSSMTSMKWQNDQEQMGFIDSHHGPCEGWIDDTRVFQYDDCRASFTAYPAVIPVDFSKCSGDCTFTFYWMAMHEPNWQMYKNCAPISNGSGGSSKTTTAPATTTVTPTITTATPSTTTSAPAASSAAGSSEYSTAASSTASAASTTSEYAASEVASAAESASTSTASSGYTFSDAESAASTANEATDSGSTETTTTPASTTATPSVTSAAPASSSKCNVRRRN